MLRASVLVLFALLSFVGCTCKSGPGGPGGGATFEAPGEPYEYAATVITTIENGAGETTSITRVARSGDKRREDWTDDNGTRTLIWRPDLGKSYLLDPVQKAFVESDLEPTERADENDADSVERAVGEAPQPVRTESRPLPARTISGYRCTGFETTVAYPDGTSKVTRLFRAQDLDIAVRIEVVQGDNRMVIERQDIQTVVDPVQFEVPADFTRVSRLERK